MKKIKYCGNCNPDVHPKYVKEAVKELFPKDEPETQVVINGCSRSCLSKSKAIKEAKEKIIIMSSRDIVRRKG